MEGPVLEAVEHGGNAVSYRPALADDLARIVEIYNSTVAGRMVTADTVPVTVASRVDWFKAHNDKRPLWVVEDAAKRIVGWVSFQAFYGRPAYDATAEISIYLDPEARGKGLGKRALKYAMESCGSLKIKTLMGFIFAHNEPSIRLFKGEGFDQWAYLPDIAVLDGGSRSVVILGKRLAP